MEGRLRLPRLLRWRAPCLLVLLLLLLRVKPTLPQHLVKVAVDGNRSLLSRVSARPGKRVAVIHTRAIKHAPALAFTRF